MSISILVDSLYFHICVLNDRNINANVHVRENEII